MSINNRKAFFDYTILEEYVAGLKLLGSEVKSLREGNASITDTFVYVNNGEVFVKGMYIAKHKESSWMNHEEIRDRKLLLTKKQIRDIQKDLKVMDATALTLCRDQQLPIAVFNIFKNGALKNILLGQNEGTLVMPNVH